MSEEPTTVCNRCGRRMSPGETWGGSCGAGCPGILSQTEMRPADGSEDPPAPRVVVVVGSHEVPPGPGMPTVEALGGPVVPDVQPAAPGPEIRNSVADLGPADPQAQAQARAQLEGLLAEAAVALLRAEACRREAGEVPVRAEDLECVRGGVEALLLALRAPTAR